MYFQLTERCNMSCAHCCFSATSKGQVMSQAVFDKALDLAKKYSQSITLGGGEPTLHPHILEWTMRAVIALMDVTLDMDYPACAIITNGKKTEIAIKLAKMAHLGIIDCYLSQDPWHDPIDERVIKEFTRCFNKSCTHIRNVEENVLRHGRAEENDLSNDNGCACDTLFIKPNGDFYKCGCCITKLGNIMNSFPEDASHLFSDECEKESQLVVS